MTSFFPNKGLGQHFLKDRGVVEKIIAQCPLNCQGIVEIGPGMGALTEPLSRLNTSLAVIEKDRRFGQQLRQWVKEHRLFMGDALAINYAPVFQSLGSESCWLVSNLPYKIAGPLMIHLFSLSFVEHMTLMMQKEVGQKLCPAPQQKNKANGLWAMGQNHFSISKVCTVPPGAFSPPPQVQSVVLHFHRRPRPVIPLKEFGDLETFCRRLFGHKRKQMLTVLSPFYGKEKVRSLLEGLGLSPLARAESLNLQEVQNLFNSLK